MERKHFVVFKSWGDAIEGLPGEVRLEIYDALFKYGVTGKFPENLSVVANALMVVFSGGMDRAFEKYQSCIENGKKGGAPTGNANAKKQPKSTENNPNQPYKEKKSEVNKSKENTHKEITAPTFDEVNAFACERGRSDLTKIFFDYFTAGGWKDKDGNRVTNWRQKFITWESRNPRSPPLGTRHEYTAGELQGLFANLDEVKF